MYALPRPLLEYVREAMVVGVMTFPVTTKQRWRKWAIGLLILSCVVEGYTLSFTIVHIPQNGLGVDMLHDRLWYYRQVLFLVLPIALYFLPGSPPRFATTSAIEATAFTMDQALGTLRILDLTRVAAMRSKEIREPLNDLWEKEEQEAKWGREDKVVKDEAERIGMGFGPNGKLRDQATKAVAMLSTRVTRAPTRSQSVS